MSMITAEYADDPRIVYPSPRNDLQIAILLREPEPDDRAMGFVLDSWVKTVAADSPWATETGKHSRAGSGSDTPAQAPRHTTPLPPSLIKYHHDTLIKKIIRNSSITLACDPDDADTIWGWICFDSDLLHFIYVKSAFRGFGIGGGLLRSTDAFGGRITTSHRTGSLFIAWPGIDFKWNPYRMLYD
jgi:hypothetical protein